MITRVLSATIPFGTQELSNSDGDDQRMSVSVVRVRDLNLSPISLRALILASCAAMIFAREFRPR
jgi:hypothetical protein